MLSPHQVVIGLAAGHIPEVYQLHGCWCHWVVSYHFGKLLSSQTTFSEQIFDFRPRPRIVGVKRGLEGVDNFFRISQFCIKANAYLLFFDLVYVGR